MPRPRLGLATLAGIVGLSLPLAAQPATLERRIADFRRDLPFVESARAFVVDAARRADSATVRETIARLDERRRGESPAWLSGYERLALLVALPATDVVEDSSAISRLLAAASTESGVGPFADEHAESLRELIRTSAQRIAARYDEGGPSDEERRFLNLLLNHLHLRGLRGRGDLGARAESFASAYDGSWRAAVVRASIIGVYREDRFGMAFSAGYRSANVLGDASEAIDAAYGAALAGEAYYDALTVILELNVGVAHAPSPFVAGGVVWPSGDLPMLAGSVVGGYEARFGRWAITPLAGLAMHSLRTEPTDERDEPLRTGLRGGFDVGAMVGYRIAFDVGTHVDLRMRAGASIMSMSGYDERLNGTLLYVQAGFALVYRPYAPGGG